MIRYRLRPMTLPKDSVAGVSLRILRDISEHFFTEPLRATASEDL